MVSRVLTRRSALHAVPSPDRKLDNCGLRGLARAPVVTAEHTALLGAGCAARAWFLARSPATCRTFASLRLTRSMVLSILGPPLYGATAWRIAG